MNVLLIVESPNKAKQIRGYFPAFNVVATVGHFKDLPTEQIGVEPPDHKPTYVVMDGKQNVIKQLCSAAKSADVIYVATDPDREGEAIAAHVVNALGNGASTKISRITYSEVTKPAIELAIKQKRGIDWPLVRAQEARRVVDRYVGYLVSGELTRKLKSVGSASWLTAGRVQSVALKLVVERQAEIAAFVSVEHYGVTITLQKDGIEFYATWTPVLPPGNLMTDIKIAKQLLQNTQSLNVTQVTSLPKRVKPPKPLITTTYVRLMAAVLKLTTKEAMDAAQRLFERGLITYHRTDSPVMADDFAQTLRDFAQRHKLPLPNEIRSFKAAANAQAGHECLRVTDIDLINPLAAGIDDDRLKAVYQLIWKITLESQLADAIDTETRVTYENSGKDLFASRTIVGKELGWRKVAVQFAAHEDAKEATEDLELKTESEAPTPLQKRLPELTSGESLAAVKSEVTTKHTAPPPVYTEKTLVEKLDKLGIGRPSTYASTIERILSVGYITRAKNLRLEATSKGVAVANTLDNQFSFMNYTYTAQMENLFDKIAERNADYLTVVHAAWTALTTEIENFKGIAVPSNVVSFADAAAKKSSSPKSTPTRSAVHSTASSPKTQGSPGDKCPTCKAGVLSVKKFKAESVNAGKSFMGCSKFPLCKYFSWVK